MRLRKELRSACACDACGSFCRACRPCHQHVLHLTACLDFTIDRRLQAIPFRLYSTCFRNLDSSNKHRKFPDLPCLRLRNIANMRFFLLSLLVALLAICVSAAVQQKPVMVTFPSDTPQSVIDNAMDAIKSAGGMVTHEFSALPPFSC